jgi:hypothetical protein
MRRLLLLLLLLCPVPAWAQFTLVGQNFTTCGTSAATCQASAGITAASGDLVVVLTSNRDNVLLSSVSDATNGAYTCPTGASISVSSTATGEGCYFIGSGAASLQPTITWASNSRGGIHVSVWRPTGTVTFDAAAEYADSVSDTALAHATGLSTGASAALVVCGWGLNVTHGGETQGTDYTAFTDDNLRWMGEYDITSVGSGTFTCAMTSTNAVIGAGAAMSFNDSGGGGGGTCTGGLMLLGAGKCD